MQNDGETLPANEQINHPFLYTELPPRKESHGNYEIPHMRMCHAFRPNVSSSCRWFLSDIFACIVVDYHTLCRKCLPLLLLVSLLRLRTPAIFRFSQFIVVSVCVCALTNYMAAV